MRFVLPLLTLLAACGSSSEPQITAAAPAPAAMAPAATAVTTPAAHTRAVGVYDPKVAEACEAGCAEHDDYDPATVVAQPGAKVGDLTRCPVSGVVFEVMPDQASVEVDGDRWFTCCTSCAGKLKETPSKFVVPA